MKLPISVRFIFAWYDLWVGFYWDRQSRNLYILPLPMLGFVISFNRKKYDIPASPFPIYSPIEYCSPSEDDSLRQKYEISSAYGKVSDLSKARLRKSLKIIPGGKSDHE